MEDALEEAGFVEVRRCPVTQSWRPATKSGRDMLLLATRPQAGSGPSSSIGPGSLRVHGGFARSSAMRCWQSWSCYGDSSWKRR